MTITRMNTLKEVTEQCSQAPKAPWSAGFMGCSVIKTFVDGHVECDVYIINDDLLRAYGSTFDITFRHERGHCNGWRHGIPEATLDGLRYR